MKTSIVFMCQGQGSQYFNMTHELYQHNELYRRYLESLDQYIYELIGCRVLDYLFDPSKMQYTPCDDLKYSSLMLFICQYALGKMLMDEGVHPDCIIGASMGEITSLALANQKYTEQIIKIVCEVADEIEMKCEQGGMLGVIASHDLFYSNNDLFEGCEIAGINFDKHFVVSGDKASIKRAQMNLRTQHIPCQKLPVNYAFHSHGIDEVEEVIKRIELMEKLDIKIASCAYGKLIDESPVHHIWDILRKPMLFEETVRKVDEVLNPIYIDLGPNGTFAGMIGRIAGTTSKAYPISSAYHKDNENLANLLYKLRVDGVC